MYIQVSHITIYYPKTSLLCIFPDNFSPGEKSPVTLCVLLSFRLFVNSPVTDDVSIRSCVY